jgi:hypothetical protein
LRMGLRAWKRSSEPFWNLFRILSTNITNENCELKMQGFGGEPLRYFG